VSVASGQRERVERLMREQHSGAAQAAVQGDHGLEAHAAGAPNCWSETSPSRPNQTWSADLTYVWTDEGCLAVVLDLFNREVVGWSINHG
jgi:transposase InsO family protein